MGIAVGVLKTAPIEMLVSSKLTGAYQSGAKAGEKFQKITLADVGWSYTWNCDAREFVECPEEGTKVRVQFTLQFKQRAETFSSGGGFIKGSFEVVGVDVAKARPVPGA